MSGGSQPQQIVQVSDGATPIIQVQDAIANGTIIQVMTNHANSYKFISKEKLSKLCSQIRSGDKAKISAFFWAMY